MPSRDAHLQFEKWAREYGPIYSLMLGTKCLIVISTPEAAKELLDRRSRIYSDRQDMYIGQTLCSGGLRGYEPRWRMSRKMIHGLLNVVTSKRYLHYQMLENRQMLYQLLNDPDGFLKHIRRYSNALTTTMVFGWRTATYEDPKMKQLFDGFSEFSAINQTGTAAIVDFFPWLGQRLPDFVLPTQRKAKELHKHEKALYLSHWMRAKQEAEDGTIKPCFCMGMYEAQKQEQFSDEQAAYIGGTLLEAGSDTTSSTLYAFVQAMLLFPDVQRKAQVKIDRVIGPERMPVMDDISDLPYIRSFTQNDEYMGYFIPAGAGILHNVWSIHMDPKRQPNPREFNPDRYKGDEQSLGDAASNPDPLKRDVYTFGAGRRICPGIHVAERSLFLAMSRILWAFDIAPALDPVTKGPIIPDPDRLTQGFVCMPEEYPARITPRSKERADHVIKEWKDAEKTNLDMKAKQWVQNPLA
ncbi:to cytochrome p450 [Aspergillus sclerotialis]|uniref:To cytochrome p450 n=1 Tax=Aspergillus sclerotialis TaxID=2070753 RepID=A0A3A2ZVL9_9EURO|nr:to cytochrome p450 [Aspergillus sclerotialis]